MGLEIGHVKTQPKICKTVAIFTIELGHGTWKSKGTTELPNAYDICTYLPGT